PYSNRYREGLNQLLIHSFDWASPRASVPFPGRSAGNRQNSGPVWSPDGSQMVFVNEGRLWDVDVDARGGPMAAPFAVAVDQPESPSWEGHSRHVVYQTPRGLQRVEAKGGTPQPLRLALEWTPQRPPGRVVVHAGRVFDGIVDGLRGESDIVVENGI